MTVIAHISDLHFGAENPLVVAGLLAELERYPVDLIAISGDLTQGARRQEFRAAGEFIARLPAPVLAVPGNHDITPFNLSERFTRPYARWHAGIAAETEPVWHDDRVVVAGVNTAHRARLHWDWSRGRFSSHRLESLRRRLATAPADLVRVVVAHHPLMASLDRPRMTLAGNAPRTLEALAAMNVRLVMSGHVHRSYSRARQAGGLLVVQCATTTSVRLRGEPNAYNRITIDDAGAIAVEVRAWIGDGWAVQ